MATRPGGGTDRTVLIVCFEIRDDSNVKENTTKIAHDEISNELLLRVAPKQRLSRHHIHVEKRKPPPQNLKWGH